MIPFLFYTLDFHLVSSLRTSSSSEISLSFSTSFFLFIVLFFLPKHPHHSINEPYLPPIL
jgi:hypothetical protein